MSFKSDRKGQGQFGNKRPPRELAIERLMPPTIKTDEDEKTKALEGQMSAKRKRRPKTTEFKDPE